MRIVRWECGGSADRAAGVRIVRRECGWSAVGVRIKRRGLGGSADRAVGLRRTGGGSAAGVPIGLRQAATLPGDSPTRPTAPIILGASPSSH